MDLIIGRFLPPLNSSKTVASVRRRDDNSRGKVRKVRADSSAVSRSGRAEFVPFPHRHRVPKSWDRFAHHRSRMLAGRTRAETIEFFLDREVPHFFASLDGAL